MICDLILLFRTSNYIDLPGVGGGLDLTQHTWQQQQMRIRNGGGGGGSSNSRRVRNNANTGNLDLVASTADAADHVFHGGRGVDIHFADGGRHGGDCNLSTHSSAGTNSQTPSVRALAGSLASFDTINAAAAASGGGGSGLAEPLLTEEAEHDSVAAGGGATVADNNSVANSEPGDTGSATYSEASSKN